MTEPDKNPVLIHPGGGGFGSSSSAVLQNATKQQTTTNNRHEDRHRVTLSRVISGTTNQEC